MDITFVDNKKHRKWTYDNVQKTEIFGDFISIKVSDLNGNTFSTIERFKDFDYVEMRKEL